MTNNKRKAELAKTLKNVELVYDTYAEQVEEYEKVIAAFKDTSAIIAELKLGSILLDIPRGKKKSVYKRWVKDTYENCLFDTVKLALEYANTPNLEVVVEKTTERGPVEWAIMPEVAPEFWLEVCKTKKAAVAFCKAMGWKV